MLFCGTLLRGQRWADSHGCFMIFLRLFYIFMLLLLLIYLPSCCYAPYPSLYYTSGAIIFISMDRQQSTQHPRFNKQYLQKAFDLIVWLTERTLNGQNRVITLRQPEELEKMIDFTIGDEPLPQKQLLEVIEKVLEESVKPYHPHFHNTLFGGFDQYAISGAMMIPFLNGNMYTYEMASCFTLMEKEVYEHFRKVLEWKEVDGIMAPGGSFGNFIAIQTARYHAFPEVKEKGIQHLPPLRIMVSDVSHYSLKKGANLAGMGTNSLVNVKTDKTGRMCPKDLEAKIKQQLAIGHKPFMVCSTIGTTVQGAIDKVQQLAEVCKRYKIWLHLDAAYGGVFLASPQLKHKIGSCRDVDSVVWDPHKGLLVPLQACVFLCRHPGVMEDCNSTAADYLFHKERKSYDNSLDTGNKSLQCGRILDILKLWIYLKGNGWKGISDQVVRQDNLAQYVKKYVQTHPEHYKLAIDEVETFNVCFWYIPHKLRRQDYADQKSYLKVLNDVTVLAKKYMIEEGKMLVGYSSAKGSIYFWRTVMSNPYIENKDVDYEMELIAKYCQQAYEEIMGQKGLKQQKKQHKGEKEKEENKDK